MPDVLTLSALDAHYGDFQALYGVDMYIEPGEVRPIEHHGTFFKVPGIHLCEPRLIWMCGSFHAGKGDNKNFEEGGLRARLTALGKKAL